VPNKTIYVSESDLPLFARAQELAEGNLSAAISKALRRFVDDEEGKQAGYDEITVRVGPGRGRKQRFRGVLLGEWHSSTKDGYDVVRLYRTQKGRYAVHQERSAQHIATGPNAEKWSTGWRAWIGDWSSEQTVSVVPGSRILRVADSLEELREILPPELYSIVVAAADQPDVEDLDI